MDLGSPWAAISAVTAAGSVVVGWVWTIARGNRDSLESLRRDLREEFDGKIASVEADQNKLRNDLQEFELHVSDNYMKSEVLERFEAKLDKLGEKFDHLKDWIHQELKETR